MAAPKDSQHNDARHKRGHIFESSEERFDIVGDLLRSDHEHGDCERKCCIDEGFEPRHRNAANEIRLAAVAHPIPVANRT